MLMGSLWIKYLFLWQNLSCWFWFAFSEMADFMATDNDVIECALFTIHLLLLTGSENSMKIWSKPDEYLKSWFIFPVYLVQVRQKFLSKLH